MNKEIFLDLCKTIWDMDDESMAYLENRLSDNWEVVPEFENLKKLGKYEDQRIRFDLNMNDENYLEIFSKEDEAFNNFKRFFNSALQTLKTIYKTEVKYSDFINNKVLFQKNTLKLKKLLDFIYKNHPTCFKEDSANTELDYSEWLMKKLEIIGTTKKSNRKLQLVISFNPVDWLLSSTAENWSSCFNLSNNKDGGFKYCLGLPFLAGDPNRMLIYITNGSQKEFMGLKTDSFQTRTWALLDKNNLFSIIKWYPNDSIGVEPVIKITGDNRFTSKDYFGESKYPIDVLATKKGARPGIFSDMGELKKVNNKLYWIGNGKEGEQSFTKNLIEINCNSSFSLDNKLNLPSNYYENKDKFNIVSWKRLGIHLDMFFPTLKCNSCSKEKTGFFINKNFLCYECFEKEVFTCENCNNNFLKKDGEFEIINTENKKLHICQNCYNKLKKCDYCGKYLKNYSYDTTDENKIICSVCFDKEGFNKCDTCLKVSKNIIMSYDTFSKALSKRCSNCSDNKTNVYIFGKYRKIIKGKKGGLKIE